MCQGMTLSKAMTLTILASSFLLAVGLAACGSNSCADDCVTVVCPVGQSELGGRCVPDANGQSDAGDDSRG